jgi:hypothetical protein
MLADGPCIACGSWIEVGDLVVFLVQYDKELVPVHLRCGMAKVKEAT